MSPEQRRALEVGMCRSAARHLPLFRVALVDTFDLGFWRAGRISLDEFSNDLATRQVVLVLDDDARVPITRVATNDLHQRLGDLDAAVIIVGEPSQLQVATVAAFAQTLTLGTVIVETTPGRELAWAGFLAALDVRDISYVKGEARP